MPQTTNDGERFRALMREYAAAADPYSPLGPDRSSTIRLLSCFAPGATLADFGADGHSVTGRVGGAVVSVRVHGLRAVMAVIAPEALIERVTAAFARVLELLPDPQHAEPVVQPPGLWPPGKRVVDFLNLRPKHAAWVLTHLPTSDGDQAHTVQT